MPDEATPPTQAQRRYLSQSIASLFIALDDLHRDMASRGSVRAETKQQLVQDLSTVIVQLRQWRDEDHIDWEGATTFETPTALLERVLQGDEEIQKSASSRDGRAEPVSKPADIPVMELYQSAMDIIDMVNDLGLTAEIDRSTETVYPDPV